MLTHQVATLVEYFQPLGDTPAVSLTQNLPPDIKANILLLGCGDVRNILHTLHHDSEQILQYGSNSPQNANESRDRTLDVTCCDAEAAVIGELLQL